MNEQERPNRLIHEKSPYLLQHAYNPVDWYPWGKEAFEKARKEDKPIFLSIGYSTCHWCHVMEKESFEDLKVAELLNESFVCIKVDREERPDIDNIYMTVCQLMTGRGGWPLTIMMTSDQKPFFAATYLPKESRFGLMGILDLVPRVKELWLYEREKVLEAAAGVVSTLEGIEFQRPESEELDISVLKSAYEELQDKFDEKYGGFGIAPKFPMPHNILFLLRYYKRFSDEKALEMAEKTLKAIQSGGIWDHVGFGVHRYSTDQYWIVPHFEKMLYDQALLALACTEAYQVTGNIEYRKTAEHIFEYVLRDMTSPEGGFYSAEDADSEGEEGKFYTWSSDEMLSAVGEEGARIFSVDNGTSPRTDESQKLTLHLGEPLSELAHDMGITYEDLDKKIEKMRKTLFKIREKRIHPHRDDKILADWNGLLIAALSRAAQVFEEDIYTTAALKAADFVLEKMVDTCLYHRFRDGDSAVPGFLDDYAFFVWGLLEVYETTFDAEYLQHALTLTEYLVAHFSDDGRGGFYTSSDEGEIILIRQKQSYDGALPSGNSVAAVNLLRLARMTGNSSFEEKAARTMRAFSREVKEMPSSHTFMLTALDFAVGPSFEVVIVGEQNSPDTKEMIKTLRRKFIPNKVVIFRPDEKSPLITFLSPFTAELTTVNGKATAYVCRDYRCSLPVTDASALLEQFTRR